LEIRPITGDDIEGFHRAVDAVARERKYLAFLEAPPLASAREFVLDNIAKGNPRFVAIADGGVVGWCDVVRQSRPIHAHAGVLGMGLLPPFRGQGHGRSLSRQVCMPQNWRASAALSLRFMRIIRAPLRFMSGWALSAKASSGVPCVLMGGLVMLS
jgi:GNAT superfamily N-acetyltransferase